MWLKGGLPKCSAASTRVTRAWVSGVWRPGAKKHCPPDERPRRANAAHVHIVRARWFFSAIRLRKSTRTARQGAPVSESGNVDYTSPRASLSDACGKEDGGAEGDRTPDLRNAIATLSQLSYGPIRSGKATASSQPSRVWQAPFRCFSTAPQNFPRGCLLPAWRAWKFAHGNSGARRAMHTSRHPALCPSRAR